MTEQLPAVFLPGALTVPADTYIVPALIADLGDQAGWRYVEFFTANIHNDHTRRAYARACGRFFAWCEQRGLALTAIRDNELAAQSNGIDVWRIKFIVYVLTAFGTAMIGALIFLQKLRISPDTAFSVNDWTAFVIFITVIGGIGRIEGPIIGTLVFFVLRRTFADLGSLYLLMLGAVAIAVMLFAPKGIWGLIADRFGWQLLPLERRLRFTPDARTT